jgi:hypothetical protein
VLACAKRGVEDAQDLAEHVMSAMAHDDVSAFPLFKRSPATSPGAER